MRTDSRKKRRRGDSWCSIPQKTLLVSAYSSQGESSYFRAVPISTSLVPSAQISDVGFIEVLL